LSPFLHPIVDQLDQNDAGALASPSPRLVRLLND
jgi:hypothetical protein